MTMPSPFARLEGAVAEAKALLLRSEAHTLLDHWADIARRGYPLRRQIDPLAIIPSLPYVWIRAFLPATRQFQCQLAGDAVRQDYDFPLVGSYLEQVAAADQLPQMQDAFERCLFGRYILVASGRLFRQLRRPGQGERLALPLYNEDGAPAGLIGLAIRDSRIQHPSSEIGGTRKLVFIPLHAGDSESELH